MCFDLQAAMKLPDYSRFSFGVLVQHHVVGSFVAALPFLCLWSGLWRPRLEHEESHDPESESSESSPFRCRPGFQNVLTIPFEQTLISWLDPVGLNEVTDKQRTECI